MNYLNKNLYSLSRKMIVSNFKLKNINKLLIQNNSMTHNSVNLKSHMCKYCVNSLITPMSLSRIKIFSHETKLKKINFVSYRLFKTSEPRRIHPIVWLVFKPFLKLTAVLSGRGFRKWWKDLPKEKKKFFLNKLNANKNKIAGTLVLAFLLSIIYYTSHLEETPITKRQRFMAFNPKQLEKINELELQQMMEKLGNQIIPANHPITKKVETLVQRIIHANADIKEVHDKKWSVSIIDNSIENAFVLPIGQVFVFTGMLKLCSNDDQLGTILAHEIAHCLQNHAVENISFTHLLDMISILIIAAIWAVLPSDAVSVLTHWLYQKSIQILLQLPYSRKIETEADKVGLQLAAKACFDVRESSAFWTKMSILKRTFGQNPEIEFLSTHPSHESRSEYLDSIMDEAIKLRKDCGCPPLRYRDPRLDVEGVSRALELTRRQFLELNPKPRIVLGG